MIEIERKFLVKDESFLADLTGEEFIQGYLCTDPERTVRVRVVGEFGKLTIKGKSNGISRSEFEYDIPLIEAKSLLELSSSPLIEKTRYRVPNKGHVWEVDVFKGKNSGLIVAEIELESEDAFFEMPKWVGEEVSNDKRYYNSQLSKVSYSEW